MEQMRRRAAIVAALFAMAFALALAFVAGGALAQSRAAIEREVIQHVLRPCYRTLLQARGAYVSENDLDTFVAAVKVMQPDQFHSSVNAVMDVIMQNSTMRQQSNRLMIYPVLQGYCEDGAMGR